MGEDGKQHGLKIFLEFWLLIAVLAGFNFYMYFGGRSKMFLIVGIICAAGFVGWAMFYVLYVRKGES